MTLPNFPSIPGFLLVIFAIPIIIFETILFLKIQAECNGWNIGEENVTENMIPPTLPKMRKYVLP